MSLIQKNNCKGIDCSIQSFQSQLFSKLDTIWGADWLCYPRIYKTMNKGQDGNTFFKPEYMDGTFEYETDTLFNDKVDVVSFFLAGDSFDLSETRPTGTISLIFSCDVTKLYPTVLHKADEEMHVDILNTVTEIGGTSWILQNIETGVDNVYSEFKKEGLEWSSISHRHLVRLNFEVNYSTNC